MCKLPVITIGRQFGSGGREIARKLSERLGIPFYDKELLALAATKKYPIARLRRGILYALCGILTEDLRLSPAYTRLLAANATGCKFFAEQRKDLQIPLVTRNAGIPQTEEAKKQAEWERCACAMYTLCLPTPKSPEALLKKNPIIR